MIIRLRLWNQIKREPINKLVEMESVPRVGEMFTFSAAQLGPEYTEEPNHFRVSDVEYNYLSPPYFIIVTCNAIA